MVDGEHAFRGPGSLRVEGEWRVLALSMVAIIVASPLLGFFIPFVSASKEIALLVVGAMLYVTFARGRLIGGSIRVHPGQFGHVYEIAEECARALRMPLPNVFVRDDPFVPIVAVGLDEPYSLIISAQWVEHLSPSELRFLIGRELAHIEAGHTRLTSLLSVNGRENAVVSILFGAWLRRIEYSADRAGLLCCASLDDALAAISVSTFHLVGRQIDLAAFSEQLTELRTERSSRIGEWISAVPYATKRMDALRTFERSPDYAGWRRRIEAARATPVNAYAPPAAPQTSTVPRKAYAGAGPRIGAFAIDLALVQALLPASIAQPVIKFDSDTPGWVKHLAAHSHFLYSTDPFGAIWSLAFALYVVVFVGFAGQTFGMLITGLRVVDDRFAPVGIARAVWRYVCMGASIAVVIGIVRIFGRIQPFEKWSHTRLVHGGALGAGAATATRLQGSPSR
jgi:Zn-dependent protease with chaperone function/uncharacterized RDD family membrane protein YckC